MTVVPRVLQPADVEAVRQTIALSIHVIDNRRSDLFHTVFTADLRFVPTGGEGDQGLTLSEFQQQLSQLPADYPRPDHHTHDTVLFENADGSVRARSRYLAVRPDSTVTSGDCLDVLVRTDEGWRVRYRRLVRRIPQPDGGLRATSWSDDWWPAAI
ncbi:nuclear transport factor 2 family protein [Parafrankia discariae]|uniref:nuclear transport factor 2 family protein n=1 Tax=Parafrankia discariae TaxID=365528 RepID=UPI000367BF7E|nr:nuclear transport factor 2 family protein [Parafrankia discariae]